MKKNRFLTVRITPLTWNLIPRYRDDSWEVVKGDSYQGAYASFLFISVEWGYNLVLNDNQSPAAQA